MCWIVCKRKTIWWRNWRSWQAGRRQPRLWGRQHVNLCKTHTLFGDFAELISICIEFTILPGLPSTFKGFLSQSDFNSYSYQVSPSIFSGFWADFRVLSVRSRPSVSDAVSHMGKRWSGTIPRRGFQSHGQFDDPSWVEPQRPPRSTHLSGRGGILLSFQPCGRSTYAPDLAT